jgi:hypothetical protein
MPGVLNSLKIRAQALSPFTQTYMYSEEPSSRRLKCTEVRPGSVGRPPSLDVLSLSSFIHGWRRVGGVYYRGGEEGENI